MFVERLGGVDFALRRHDLEGVGQDLAVVGQGHLLDKDECGTTRIGFGSDQKRVALPGRRGDDSRAVLLKRDLAAIGGVATGGSVVTRAAFLLFGNGERWIGLDDAAGKGSGSGDGSESAFGRVHFPFAGEVGVLVRSGGEGGSGEDTEGGEDMVSLDDMSHYDMLAHRSDSVKGFEIAKGVERLWRRWPRRHRFGLTLSIDLWLRQLNVGTAVVPSSGSRASIIRRISGLLVSER